MLKIKNWKEFQHFKDRSPPWIKLYRENLYRRDIMLLSDRNFKILICLWLLASEDKLQQGNLPEIADIAYKLRLSESEIIKAIKDLSRFVESDDINPISTRYQLDAPETETETETETDKEKNFIKKEMKKPDDVSEQVWQDYKTHRKAKKAPITETGINRTRKEALKAGMTLEEAMIETCAQGWQGFKAEYVQQKGNQHGKTKQQRAMDALDRAEALLTGGSQTNPLIGIPKL